VRWVLFLCPRPSRTNSTLPTRTSSALRYPKVAHRPEVADSVDARNCPQKTVDINCLRYSRAPDALHYGFSPVHTSLYVRVTWDWCDSWNLSHLGYLYPGTTPVMIKLDHDRSCPWVQIAQVTKVPTITPVPRNSNIERRMDRTKSVVEGIRGPGVA